MYDIYVDKYCVGNQKIHNEKTCYKTKPHPIDSIDCFTKTQCILPITVTTVY